MKGHTIKLCAQAVKVLFPDNDSFQVDLADGRSVIIPIAWFPRLLRAMPEQLRNAEVCAGGTALRWPDVDEDVSVEGLLGTGEMYVWPDTDMRIDGA